MNLILAQGKPTLWDVKFRGKDIGYLYVAEDGFLRYAKTNYEVQ